MYKVEGGVLLGVGNGDPNSHEADVANKRSLFHGRCQGIVIAAEGSKEIIIRVLSEGIVQMRL